MFRKLKRYLKDPYFALGCDMIKKCPNLMSDKFFVETSYRIVMGRKINLDNPKTFNEKLNWLKLFDHNPLYTTLVDKIKVKDWVAERIGAEYIIPTLAVWDTAEDIDITNLPNQFVLKCNHDSGSVIICRDKKSFDIEDAKKKLSKALKYNFYYQEREWPYKNVKPMILAEQYLEDTDRGQHDIDDYKVFTFNGEPKLIQVDIDRFKDHHRNLYDTVWNYIDAQIEFPNSPDQKQQKPELLNEMLRISRILSEKLPHARCDFYLINNKIYFGEITFYHGGGQERFMPRELEDIMGDWLRIDEYITMGGVFACDNCILYIHPQETKGLVDYKFYCFNGEPKFLYVSRGLEDHDVASIDFLTMDYALAPFQRADFRRFDNIPPRPKHYEEMIDASRRLAQGFPFVRVDWYEINKNVLFSEMTFCPGGGITKLSPDEYDAKIGNWLKL